MTSQLTVKHFKQIYPTPPPTKNAKPLCLENAIYNNPLQSRFECVSHSKQPAEAAAAAAARGQRGCEKRRIHSECRRSFKVFVCVAAKNTQFGSEWNQEVARGERPTLESASRPPPRTDEEFPITQSHHKTNK